MTLTFSDKKIQLLRTPVFREQFLSFFSTSTGICSVENFTRGGNGVYEFRFFISKKQRKYTSEALLRPLL